MWTWAQTMSVPDDECWQGAGKITSHLSKGSMFPWVTWGKDNNDWCYLKLQRGFQRWFEVRLSVFKINCLLFLDTLTAFQVTVQVLITSPMVVPLGLPSLYSLWGSHGKQSQTKWVFILFSMKDCGVLSESAFKVWSLFRLAPWCCLEVHNMIELVI